MPNFRPRGVLVAVLATTIVTSAVRSAEAEDTVDYQVVAGDTCVGIAIRQLGDRAAYKRIHELNPELGPLPHTLRAGQVLRLPRAGRAAADANLTRSRGAVEVKRPSADDWARAERGMDLFRAWRVGARDRSSAEVTFRDTSRLFMRENTVVVIYGDAASRVRVMGTRAELERGALESRLAELRGKPALVVTTPSAEARLPAGTSLVDVDAASTSRVANHGGQPIAVRGVDRNRRPTGPTVRVADNMGSRVDPGKRPSPPRPLPPAPAWQVSGAIGLALGETSAPVVARWAPVVGAARYRVALRDEAGADVTALTAPGDASAIELHRLPAGVYQALIATVDQDGFEGKPSAPLPIEVVALAASLPGGIELGPPTTPAAEADAPAAHDQASPALPIPLGSLIRVPAGASCQLGEGPVADPLVVITPGETTVRCARAGLVMPAIAIVGQPIDLRLDRPPSVHPGETASIAVRGAEPALAEIVDFVITGGRVVAATPIDRGVDLRIRADDDVTGPIGVRVVLRAAPTVVLAHVDLPTRGVRAQAEAAGAGPTASTAPSPLGVELGGYLGYHTFPAGLTDLVDLGNTTDPALAVTSGPELGGRAGLWMGRHVGLEAELGLIPTGFAGVDGSATILSGRGHGMARLLADGRYELRGQLGVGVLALLNERRTAEREIDSTLDYGLALTVAAPRGLRFRIDARHAIGAGQDAGYSHMFVLQLGLSRRR